MVNRHVYDREVEPPGELARVALGTARAEQEHLRARHESGADEAFRAGLLVIAVDQGELGTHPHERAPRRLSRLREMRAVAGEFDCGTQERGGEWIGGEDQYGVSAHVLVGSGGSIARGVAGETVSAARGRPTSAIMTMRSTLDVKQPQVNIRRSTGGLGERPCSVAGLPVSPRSRPLA